MRREFIIADGRAEEELLEETVSYRKDVTGIENTIFISPKGNAQPRRGSRSPSTRRYRSIPGPKPHPLRLPTARL